MLWVRLGLDPERRVMLESRKWSALVVVLAMLMTLVGVAVVLRRVAAPGNNPPILNWVDAGTNDTRNPFNDDGVNPDTGPPGAFTFQVRYTDLDGDWPTYVRVVVGGGGSGGSYNMTFLSGSCSSPLTGCVYSALVTLTVRSWYTHQFLAQDSYP